MASRRYGPRRPCSGARCFHSAPESPAGHATVVLAFRRHTTCRRAALRGALRVLPTRHPPPDRSALRGPDGVSVDGGNRLRVVGVTAGVGGIGQPYVSSCL